MLWTRRALLKFLPGAAAWATLAPLAARANPPLLRVTDPHCPEGAFDETMAELRKLEALNVSVTEKERLSGGRAWLGGSPEFKPQLRPEGRWLTASTSQGPLELRVLQPPGKVNGVVLSLHGGGWAVGAATSDETSNWALAQAARVAVVSPEYRLAPEHPWPAGPSDCLDAARWLIENSRATFGTNRLAVIGNSAGAHLAAWTLLNLNPQQRLRFEAAVLFYGVYDLSGQSWEGKRDLDYPSLTPTSMGLFTKWLLPELEPQARGAAQYSPLQAKLGTLPPALFLVGGGDILAGQTESMALRWAKAGNLAELVVYPGAPHGFNGYSVSCGLDPNGYARDFIADFLS